MRYLSCLCMLGIVPLFCALATTGAAQERSPKPFVEYRGSTAQYLRRLHGQPGQLAWRKDYPGGFSGWQKAARRKLQELLGLGAIAASVGKHRTAVRVGERSEEEGYARQRGEIDTEPGVTIPFWLLTPSTPASGKRAVVICAHGHDNNGWNTYAGVYTDDRHRTATLAKDGNIGVQAVKRGYVAIVPATRGLAEDVSIPDPRGRHGNRACRAQLIHCLLAGRTPVGERVWDTQRLIDWVVREVPDIDSSKIVMLGNSGGGVLTVYAAALDERVTVAVPSCSFSSFTSTTGYIFHCDCCLIPRAQNELGDMSDIGALTAPRSLLAVHGRRDGLHSSPDVERAMERVRTIYVAAGAPGRFQHRWADGGHKFYPKIMWPFIDKQLRQIDSAGK